MKTNSRFSKIVLGIGIGLIVVGGILLLPGFPVLTLGGAGLIAHGAGVTAYEVMDLQDERRDAERIAQNRVRIAQWVAEAKHPIVEPAPPGAVGRDAEALDDRSEEPTGPEAGDELVEERADEERADEAPAARAPKVPTRGVVGALGR